MLKFLTLKHKQRFDTFLHLVVVIYLPLNLGNLSGTELEQTTSLYAW
jgi:hypothetical protein